MLRLVLSVLLGAFFIFAGTTKLTGQVEQIKAMHEEHVTNFREKYIKVWPQIAQQGIGADQFRFVVGVAEVACGALLLLRVHWLVNVVLMGIMGGAIYTHHSLNESVVLPAVVLVLLLLPLLLPKGGQRSPAPRASSTKSGTPGTSPSGSQQRKKPKKTE